MKPLTLLCLLLALEVQAKAPRQAVVRNPFAEATPIAPANAKPTPRSDLRTVSVYSLQWQGVLRYDTRSLILLRDADGRTQALSIEERIGAEKARVIALDAEHLLLQVDRNRRLQLRLAPAGQATETQTPDGSPP